MLGKVLQPFNLTAARVRLSSNQNIFQDIETYLKVISAFSKPPPAEKLPTHCWYLSKSSASLLHCDVMAVICIYIDHNYSVQGLGRDTKHHHMKGKRLKL